MYLILPGTFLVPGHEHHPHFADVKHRYGGRPGNTSRVAVRCELRKPASGAGFTLRRAAPLAAVSP